jgi:hypothetical protein
LASRQARFGCCIKHSPYPSAIPVPLDRLERSTRSSTTFEKHVDGQIHTNGCENFWSLPTRPTQRTCVSDEPFHLFGNLDERAFRLNERPLNDAGRFFLAHAGIIYCHLT